ncbi:HHE domain-containing protein [Colletotrichum tofieldiae]|uniref:HHE domain-containing protein n=1 Tax=Colletotrichum tofieldiae TaxID=708197 RepID=A0A166M0B0_9PEZI|nr:HHE domain-containing protein [Colletotrichum tofieldiae]
MPRLCDVIKNDHRKIEQAYRYTLISTTPEDRAHWRDELALELARHCISEEQVLLPILRDRLADSEFRITKNCTDRHSLKEKICRLKVIHVTDPNLESELKALWVDLAPHIHDTDHQDVARLEECLSITESENLAEQFRRTMFLAPTRSNPSPVRGPPSQLITHFLSAKENSIKDMNPILGTR